MRILKILGILFLIFALVVLGAWLYIKHEFPPEELSRRLAGFLSDQLGSPVEIGSADVRLFRGISLQDVRIFQPPPQEQQEWLRIKEIRLGYQWQALLHRRLAINNVTILQPKLTLAAEKTPEKTKPREIAPPETTETALPLEIRVKRVEIVQAALDYRLPLANGTLRAQLSGLDLSLAGLLLTDLAPENLFRSGLRFGLDLHRARFSAEASFDRAVRLDTLQIAGLILRGIPTGRLRFRAERDSVAAADTLRAPLTLSVALKNAQLQAIAPGDSALSSVGLPGVTFRLEGEARPRAPAWQGRLQARLGDFFLCELQTEGSGANRETLWHLAADTLGISLNRAFAALFAQKNWLRLLAPADSFGGRLVANTLELSGSNRAGAVQTEIRAAFRLDGGFLKNASLELDGLFARAEGRGRISGAGVQTGSLSVDFKADSVRSFGEHRTYSLGKQFAVHGEANLGRNAVPRSAYLEFSGRDVLNGNLSGAFELETRGVRSFADLDIHHIRGMGDVSLTGLDLERSGAEGVSGTAEFSLALNTDFGYASDFAADVALRQFSVIFDTTEGWELLPDTQLSLIGQLRSSPGLQKFWLDSLQLFLADLVRGEGSAFFNLAADSSALEIDSLTLDFYPLERYLPSYLREELFTALWRGEATLSAEVIASPDTFGQVIPQIRGELRVDNPVFDNPYWGIRLDSLRLGGIFGGTLETLQLDLEGKIGGLEIVDVAPEVWHTAIQASLEISELDRLDVLDLRVFQPQWGLHFWAFGMLDSLSTGPYFDLDGRFELQSSSRRQLLYLLDYSGTIGGRFAAVSLAGHPEKLHLFGRADLDGVTFFLTGDNLVEDVQGSVPFDQIYDLETAYFVPDSTRGGDVRTFAALYDVFQPYSGQGERHTGVLRARRACLGEYEIDRIELPLQWKQGVIFVPGLRAELYGGNFLLNALVDLSTGALADISYRISGRLAGVNSALLPGVGEKKAAPFSFLMQFRGKGVDIAAAPAVEGAFEVTEISARTADYFLRSIDPLGTDKTISNVRFLLNHGYRPRHMALRIQHGYLYPSISLSQPWYWPVKIAGGKIALSRLPLRALLRLVAPAQEVALTGANPGEPTGQ